MDSKSVVSLMLICFSVDKVLTHNPPKVPQLFLPDPAPSKTLEDVPLTIQAIQTAMPNAKGSSCYETLSKILEILASREQGRKSGAQTLMPAVEMLKEIKNDDKLVKKAIDITSDVMKDLLEKNYQYQTMGANMYKIGTLRKSAAPTNAITNPVKIATLPEDYFKVYGVPNVYRAPTNVFPKASYVGRSLPNQNVVPNPQCPILDRNVWPVVPVTKINGCLSDNDAVVVVYKPKVLSVSNTYGNVVKQTASKMLVPYYVSRLR